jgi:N4-gp56 family major capsid protein
MDTTSTLTAEAAEYYTKTMLQTLQPRLVLEQFAEKTALPKNNGKLVSWRRFGRIAGDKTGHLLQEGIVPSASALSVNKIEATIAQYGDYASVSDLLSMTGLDNVIEKASEQYGYAAADLIEQLIEPELVSTATTDYVEDAANDAAVTAAMIPTLRDYVKEMVRLKKTFVKKHPKLDAYGVVLHPSHEFDLLGESNVGGLIDSAKYGLADAKALMQGEVGKAYGMRFFVSDAMTSAANASSVTVCRDLIIGEQPFGTVALDKSNAEIFAKPLGSGGTSDPLNQVATIGYKVKGFVCKSFKDIPGSSTIHRVRQLRSASAGN